MPAPTTPDEWLPVLWTRLVNRRPTTERLRSYTDGNAPLPEMGRNLRAAWEMFQKKSRTNFGGLACEAVVSRISPLGVVISGDGEGTDAATVTAERIWRDNRFVVQIKQAIRDAQACRVGYLLVSQDGGKAVVRRRRPEDFIAAADPIRPWRARAYLNTWTDVDEGKHYAYVGAQGSGQLFSAPIAVTETRGITQKAIEDNFRQHSGEIAWSPEGEPDTYSGDPKVIILERANGLALVEPHFDIIDRINHGKLNRLVITAMQAFRQRALKSKEGGGLPSKDEDGNDIDWAKAFEPAPGALWELPDGITDIWESESLDIRPLLDGEKSDARDFAAVTRIPVAVFSPEGANQSAQGAGIAQDGLYSQARDEIAAFEPAVNMALVYALQAEGVDVDTMSVSVQFAPVELVTMAERYDAATKAKDILARRTIQRDLLGMSPEQIAQDDADRAAEQFDTLLAGLNTPDPNADVATA